MTKHSGQLGQLVDNWPCLICATLGTVAVLFREMNLIRFLTARSENSYCSITVANHGLITVIRFVAQSCTHL